MKNDCNLKDLLKKDLRTGITQKIFWKTKKSKSNYNQIIHKPFM
jgi:hypothetical protein